MHAYAAIFEHGNRKRRISAGRRTPPFFRLSFLFYGQIGSKSPCFALNSSDPKTFNQYSALERSINDTTIPDIAKMSRHLEIDCRTPCHIFDYVGIRLWHDKPPKHHPGKSNTNTYTCTYT